MCGIAGFVGGRKIGEEAVVRTLSVMKNRGPDNQSYIEFKHDDVYITLLHSRLSIIDLETRANQPFSIGDYTIVYNGEIYNYLELRKNMQAKGISFFTESDTEVLLRYFIMYGERCVDYFQGMWAFAILDRKNRMIFLSRDRFAEKPLYYAEDGSGIYFASEIKYLKTLSGKRFDINNNQVLRYLVNGYKALYKSDETFFREINEVPYATNLKIDYDCKYEKKRYWRPQLQVEPGMTFAEAAEGVKERLIESVRLRLRADVPLAFCLSGGVDSASLASIASRVFGYKVVSFSIVDDDERYNEYSNIMATVDDLKCDHTIIKVSRDSFLERLSMLIDYHDSPISTISYYVHSFLSESIAEQGFRVAVSGTAADELFTGYYDHFNLHLYEMRLRDDYQSYLNDWKLNISEIVRNPYLQDPELYFNHPERREHIYLNNDVFAGFLRTGFNELFTENHYCDELLRNRMMNELFHEAIPVILHEDDLNSMYYSIENRSPYLDTDLCKFAYSIPTDLLIRKGYGKFILREAVKGILNEKVRTDRKKIGFNASINSLIDFDSAEQRRYLLDDSPVFDIIEKERIEEAMNINPMPNSYSKFMFNFINTKIFVEKNS
ncbi:MAG TPA: asparagine synthase (glutamine-hydrolyzing) [Syntrophorhabdaceae bacterium]|nr:asparagine synthase (glutamine-hydrolyzing) [Syntrophorhabdaceae bacterium]